MPDAQLNGIRIHYDTLGDVGAEPLLLVMGLGAQMIQWRPELCQRLADAGHRVIRFDNRDVGLSTRFDTAGTPDMATLYARAAAGDAFDVPYTLDDMAADGFALLDHLGIGTAHLCGASMGGAIVQCMAINQPQRVRSLTSIMATTGNPTLPPATPEAMAALMLPPAADAEAAAERALAVSRVIGSPGLPQDEDDIRARGREAFLRANYPAGVVRQMAAIAVSGNRFDALTKLTVPSLVIHGVDDPLVNVAGGLDTHAALSAGGDAMLELIDGMGHDLPRAVWPHIVKAIAQRTGVA
ncbi:MAG: alpha/beta hydrolase [Pseudomonadales bacterium]